MKFRKTAAVLAAFVIAVPCAAGIAACIPDKGPADKEPVYKAIGAESDFLKADGTLIKNGEGETVILRGVNAGGLFVTEHWMTGFIYNTKPNNDYKSLTRTFIERFGEEKTKALWAEYHANWWSETDFKNCADMGINVIRLPFTYMNVDFGAITDYEKAGNYDFSDLDGFVEKAAEYGMYTILDLHGAYGSQSGQDHSGEILDLKEVDFYSNGQMQTLTVNLWGALAEHYKDNPAVAGYDILNEPGEKGGSTGEAHWAFYDKVYDAIRAKGDDHIVIFESCWDGKNLPQPSEYGWENCMYSFHHYTSNTDTSESGILSHNLSWNDKIDDVNSQNFGVPVQMGEFSAYTSVEKWEYTLGLLNRAGWHWASWTYKVWGSMPWGIVNISGSNDEKVDALNDGYDTILDKFRKLHTDGGSVNRYTFYTRNENGERVEKTTLEKIFTEYCKAPANYARISEGSYKMYYGDGNLPLNADENSALISGGQNGGETFTFSYHRLNDGSVNIYAGRKILTAGTDGKITLASGSSGDSASRFFPVVCDDGVAFISRSTCKYLRVDGGGAVRADASRSDAAVFVLG